MSEQPKSDSPKPRRRVHIGDIGRPSLWPQSFAYMMGEQLLQYNEGLRMWAKPRTQLELQQNPGNEAVVDPPTSTRVPVLLRRLRSRIIRWITGPSS